MILLLSNNIISINPLNGDINWEFEYANDNTITSYGGSIISDKNILYFILPNGYFGGIDSIIAEPIDSEFFSHLFWYDKDVNWFCSNLLFKFISLASNSDLYL